MSNSAACKKPQACKDQSHTDTEHQTSPPPPLSDLSSWFGYHSRDQGGNLDREKIVAALCKTSPFDQRSVQSVREPVHALWSAFDQNGDGTIDKREFCAPGGMGEILISVAANIGKRKTHRPTRTQLPQSHPPLKSNETIEGPAALGVTKQNHQHHQPKYQQSAHKHQKYHFHRAQQPADQHQKTPYEQSAHKHQPADQHHETPYEQSAHKHQKYQFHQAQQPAYQHQKYQSHQAQQPADQHQETLYEQSAHQHQQYQFHKAERPADQHQETPYEQPAYQHKQQHQSHQNQHNEQYETMRVEIPPGTVPGQKLIIRYLHGQETIAKIPEEHEWDSKDPPAFDVQVPINEKITAEETPAPGPASASPPAPKPAQIPWQSYDSFRGHLFQEVPLATTTVPSHEVFYDEIDITSSGRRKALLVGIKYTDSRIALQGCVNDANNIKHLLMENGFEDDPTHMVMLVDEGAKNSNYLPTKENILRGFQWLVQGASEGDVLFFHFSGHGSQVPDKSGMETDGLNETILPLDYENGQITDDEIWSSIVYPLPSGVKLTVIMDCCHSGTVLDLPYEYERNFGGWIEEINPAHSKGHVVLFAGCEDSQTSADAIDQYQAGGAMTRSFISAYRHNPMPTYPDLMASMHDQMKRWKFTQRPQLTSSQTFDAKNSIFSFVEGIQPNKNKVIGRIKRKHIKPGSTRRRKRSVIDDVLSESMALKLAATN